MKILILILCVARPLESFTLGSLNYMRCCNQQANIRRCRLSSNIDQNFEWNYSRLDSMKHYNEKNDAMDVFTSDKDTKSLFDLDLFKKVCQSLWFLPVLSILSGLSPSVKIIAQSHTSRMPDNPIAHDIDTLLLWPAVADEQGLLSIHVFEAPVAAVTDSSLYNVDWELVQRTYFNVVSHSLLWSLILSLSLYFYLIQFDTSDTSSSRNKI